MTDPKPMDPERPELPPAFVDNGDCITGPGWSSPTMFDDDGESRDAAVSAAWDEFSSTEHEDRQWVEYADYQERRAEQAEDLAHDHAVTADGYREELGRALHRAEQAERERDEALARAAENRGDYVRAHGLLCDLHRRLRRALLPSERAPDWDDIVVTAEYITAEVARLGNAADELAHRVIAENHERIAALAEVTRLRARVRVEESDVERAGVTREHVEAWMAANGWGAPTQDKYGWTSAESETGGEPVDLWRTDGSTPVALTVCFIADDIQRPGLDILDEMAAMEVE